MPAPLFGKGWLQEAVEKVINAVEAGKIKLPEGKEALTPTLVAKLVGKAKKMEKPPSVGAVSAVFDRWEEYGYATFTASPRAFKAWGKNHDKGIDGVKAERLEARRAEREANKPAKPAKKAAAKKAAAKSTAKGGAKKAPAKKAATKKAAATKAAPKTDD